MSIYATLLALKVPANGEYSWSDEGFVRVTFQSVPPHIGHPRDYPEGDPYASFLPPPVEDADGALPRAVVVIDDLTTKGTAEHGQQYVNPILVLSGAEYQQASFRDLLYRILDAVAERWRVEAPCSVCGRMLYVEREPGLETLCDRPRCTGTAQMGRP